MQRRTFLGQSLLVAAAAKTAAAQVVDLDVNAHSSPSLSGSILVGSPIVAGPAADSLTVLQAVAAPATGFAEYRVGDGAWQRVDFEANGLLPFAPHVLKFRLPALPVGVTVIYRVTAASIAYRNAYNITRGPDTTSAEHTLRMLDPASPETRFVVWNDTHENLNTLRALVTRTAEAKPDFVLWNGDQTNDVYEQEKMTAQYLAPDGLPIAADWPLAYARGNHDVRGPAARHLGDFTGTPLDRFYYWFRSGPLAAIVMDTGEDKPDEHPAFAGLTAFAAMRKRQTEWLTEVIREPAFKSAPHRVLFCHIPLWWTDETSDAGYWTFSKVCRDAWLPLLREAGVELVVSGHTHRATWLPADASRPIGQLIGGGPEPERATIMLGHATAEKLTIDMQSLTGKTLHRIELPAD